MLRKIQQPPYCPSEYLFGMMEENQEKKRQVELAGGNHGSLRKEIAETGQGSNAQDETRKAEKRP
jgi:hypothetical protein